ncbi:MAG TPA: TolC family protein [Bacteroidia bacterium]|jgi:outer membrane protein TolC|nr:TolC family protein [Bacteroidia bacterium]
MYLIKYRVGIVTSILVLNICSLGFAQIGNKIGLKQAIDSAIKNYPELNAKQLETESADAAVRDAKDQRLPSLNISDQVDLGTANSLDGSYFPMGIVPSTSGGITVENNASAFSGNIGVAYMEHELYNFGLNHARIASAKSFASSSRADYNATSYTVQLQISQLFFELLKYRLLANIQQKNIERFSVLYNYIKAYTGSGIKAGVDSSVANAEVSKAKIQYIQTLEIYNKLKSEFSYYTGIRSKDFEIDTGAYHLPNALMTQLQLTVSADSVSSSNPILVYYNSQWQYAVSQEELIKKSYLPKLYLVGSLWMRGSSISPTDVYGDYSTGLNYSRYNYMAGLAFAYNIIDIVHRRDKVATQYFHAEAVHEEMNQQKLLLNNQLQEADIAVQAVLDRAKEIPIQLRAAQNAYAQKSAQYNAGIANIAELTDASYLLYRAETDAVEIESDLLNTLLQKAAANNTLNSFLSNF